MHHYSNALKNAPDIEFIMQNFGGLTLESFKS